MGCNRCRTWDAHGSIASPPAPIMIHKHAGRQWQHLHRLSRRSGHTCGLLAHTAVMAFLPVDPGTALALGTAVVIASLLAWVLAPGLFQAILGSSAPGPLFSIPVLGDAPFVFTDPVRFLFNRCAGGRQLAAVP